MTIAGRGIITINVLLILTVREIIFSRAKQIMGHFNVFFEGIDAFVPLYHPEFSEG
jgi:hypothetical protein